MLCSLVLFFLHSWGKTLVSNLPSVLWTVFSNKPEKWVLFLALCDLKGFLPLNFSGVPFLMCICWLICWIFKGHPLQISRVLFLCSLIIFGILPWSLLLPWPPSSVFSTQESARTVLGSFHYAVNWGNHGVCLIYLRSLSFVAWWHYENCFSYLLSIFSFGKKVNLVPIILS